MTSLILRIVRQMKTDRRTLGLILFAPIMIISLLYLLLGESSYKPAIGLDGSVNAVLAAAIERQDADFRTIGEGADSDSLLKDKTVDAVISQDAQGIRIRMLEEDGTKAAKVTEVLKEALAEIDPSARMDMSFVYGRSGRSTFDSLGYIILGNLSFFFVFILSGISFVRERTTGTMERLMVSPVRRIGVILGYGSGYGIFAALQGILFILYCRYVLGMDFEGSVFLAMPVMVLIALSAVLTGALLSIFANNEFQVMQFIPIIIVPQMFLSGILSIDTLPFGLGRLAYFMPVYYGCLSLKGVIVNGDGIGKIWGSMAMLGVFIAVLLLLNTAALRKYRKL